MPSWARPSVRPSAFHSATVVIKIQESGHRSGQPASVHVKEGLLARLDFDAVTAVEIPMHCRQGG